MLFFLEQICKKHLNLVYSPYLLLFTLLDSHVACDETRRSGPGDISVLSEEDCSLFASTTSKRSLRGLHTPIELRMLSECTKTNALKNVSCHFFFFFIEVFFNWFKCYVSFLISL